MCVIAVVEHGLTFASSVAIVSSMSTQFLFIPWRQMRPGSVCNLRVDLCRCTWVERYVTLSRILVAAYCVMRVFVARPLPSTKYYQIVVIITAFTLDLIARSLRSKR